MKAIKLTQLIMTSMFLLFGHCKADFHLLFSATVVEKLVHSKKRSVTMSPNESKD